MIPSVYDIARFWMKVRERDHGYVTPCWVWTGSTNGRYGLFYIRGGPQKATRTGRIYVHRFAWLLLTGKLPTEKVLHRCDVPLCVRFDHIFEGTQADNLADMASKGRSANLKLTPSARAEMIERIESGELTHPQAMSTYGISRSRVQQVLAAHRATQDRR